MLTVPEMPLSDFFWEGMLYHRHNVLENRDQAPTAAARPMPDGTFKLARMTKVVKISEKTCDTC